MAPIPDDGGGSGPTYTSPDTEVSPANLESFATYLDALAENWADEDGYAKKVNNQLEGDDDWPEFGSFQAATNLKTRYTQAHKNMITAAGQIHICLTGLANAARKIAENYKTAEELNNASVDKVEKALNDELDDLNKQGGTNPTDPTNGQDGGDGNPEQ